MQMIRCLLVVAFSATTVPLFAQKPKDVPVKRIVDGLASDDFCTRAVARQQIQDMGKDARVLVPAIVKLLNAENSTTRGVAAVVLGEIGEAAKGCVPQLEKCLRDKDKSVRFCAAMALGRIGKPSEPAIQSLVAALKDKATRLAAAQALFAISKHEAAIPALVECLSNEHSWERASAAMILGKYGPRARQSESALKKLLKDDDAQVRIYCAEALWHVCRCEDALATLAKELKSQTGIYWYTAAGATWRTKQDPTVIKLLIKPLKSEDDTDRFMAALTLRDIGPSASEALPALRSLASNDPERIVRDVAAQAVKAISQAMEPCSPP